MERLPQCKRQWRADVIAAVCAFASRPVSIASLECNCSICAKKGFLHLIVAPQQFQLLSGKDDLTSYEFNTRTAKHTFCKHCGIHPFYVPRSDPDKIDVNARCLDVIDVAAITPKLFDGRNWEAAMQRRPPWR